MSPKFDQVLCSTWGSYAFAWPVLRPFATHIGSIFCCYFCATVFALYFGSGCDCLYGQRRGVLISSLAKNNSTQTNCKLAMCLICVFYPADSNNTRSFHFQSKWMDIGPSNFYFQFQVSWVESIIILPLLGNGNIFHFVWFMYAKHSTLPMQLFLYGVCVCMHLHSIYVKHIKFFFLHFLRFQLYESITLLLSPWISQPRTKHNKRKSTNPKYIKTVFNGKNHKSVENS